MRVNYYPFEAEARPLGDGRFALFDADDQLEMDIEFGGSGAEQWVALPLMAGTAPLRFGRESISGRRG